MDNLVDMKMYQDQPHLILLPVVAIGFAVYRVLSSGWFDKQKEKMAPKPTFQLHKYQHDFLVNMAYTMRLPGPGPALECIANRAMRVESVRSAIFDDFHCVHCGSVKPAEWIANSRGKQPYKLAVGPMVVDFLSDKCLVKVEKVGDPPKKQVVEGEKWADKDKAARVCIDWAIKNNGALEDGKFKNMNRMEADKKEE